MICSGNLYRNLIIMSLKRASMLTGGRDCSGLKTGTRTAVTNEAAATRLQGVCLW